MRAQRADCVEMESSKKLKEFEKDMGGKLFCVIQLLLVHIVFLDVYLKAQHNILQDSATW